MANPNPNPGAIRAGFFPRRPQHVPPVNLRNEPDHHNRLSFEEAEVIVARAWGDFVGRGMAQLQPRLPFPGGIAPFAFHEDIMRAQEQLPLINLAQEDYKQAYIDEAYRLIAVRNQAVNQLNP